MPTHRAAAALLIQLLIAGTHGVVPIADQTQIVAQLDVIEARLDLLATQAAEYLSQSNCPNETCLDNCVTAGCGSTFTNLTCVDYTTVGSIDPATHEAMCGCLPGVWQGLEQSTVQIPPGIDFSNSHTQLFLCSTQQLDAIFAAGYEEGTGKREYLADVFGVTRVFPGQVQNRTDEKCEPFEVQTKSWFVSASIGPKNIVIILDRSGSMHWFDYPDGSVCKGGCDDSVYSSRWTLALPAINALLEGFTGCRIHSKFEPNIGELSVLVTT